MAITFVCADVQDCYRQWPGPTVIISDGAYGIGGFAGDPPTPHELPAWYEPHIAAWAERATPETTLWFWNTEIGWATVHPLLEKYGWEYRGLNIWDKGIAHIAGNCNTLTMRKFPVVTEVCAHYVRRVEFHLRGHSKLSLQHWLRAEWLRTGLPLSKANEACGVKNAATRKYLTLDHRWYMPPPEVFAKLVAYANTYGDPAGRPYFSFDGRTVVSASDWQKLCAKFYCPVGVTNVWREPAVRGAERIKHKGRAVHLNQKPFALMERIICASSDPGDVVWEPFGGLATASIAAHRLGRRAYGAEINPLFYKLAQKRIQTLTTR